MAEFFRRWREAREAAVREADAREAARRAAASGLPNTTAAAAPGVADPVASGAGGARGAVAHPLDAWLRLGFDEEAVWSGVRPGPSAQAVASRLGSAPKDFLDPRVDLDALAGDVLLAPHDTIQTAAVLALASADPRRRAGAALALWLWASEDLVEPFDPPIGVAWAHTALAALALRLAPTVPPERWLIDQEHREEAARLFLLWNRALPAGEDLATARARWDRRDTLVRDAALAEAVRDQRHRLEVQRALEEKRAAEAAARYSHE